MKSLRWFSVAGLLLLCACQAVQTLPVPPTPHALTVVYPPSLRPWVDRLVACAEDPPLFLNELPASQLAQAAADISLHLGDQENAPGEAFQLGAEQMVLVVNAQSTQKTLTAEQWQAIWMGQVPDSNGAALQLWIYPPESDLGRLGEAAFGARPPSAGAMLAPDPQAMLEAISKETGRIGLLPESWLAHASASRVRQVELPTALAGRLNFPVLAVAAPEPPALLRSVLACVQTR